MTITLIDETTATVDFKACHYQTITLCTLSIGSYHRNRDQTSTSATTSKAFVIKAQACCAQEAYKISRQKIEQNLKQKVKRQK